MMNRMLKLLLLAIVMCSFQLRSSAQQDAMFSQYVLNTLSVNPAYAGYKEAMTINALHRSQWVGFKGAPITDVISMDTPLKKNFNIGGTMMFDKIGPTTELTLMLDGAYRMKLTNRAYLSFGLKAVMSLYQINLTDLALVSEYYDEEDQLFQENTNGLFIPNTGFGAFFSDRDHFISLSVPRILQFQYESKNSEAWQENYGTTQPTAYLMAGKMFHLNRDFKFQPTLLFKATQNAPISAGLYANLYIYDVFRVGVFYNHKEVAGALFQFEIDRNWKIGYSVDIAVSKLATTNYGSHEIFLSYQFNSKNRRIVYPRYF